MGRDPFCSSRGGACDSSVTWPMIVVAFVQCLSSFPSLSSLALPQIQVFFGETTSRQENCRGPCEDFQRA
jgi:hypothetical protein